MDRLTPWLRRSGWAYLALAVALGVLGWRISGRSSAPTQPPVAAGIAGATISPRPPRDVIVHVTGAVKKPGIYRVDDGERVNGVIRRAGGPTSAADLTAVNLAAPVQDGQQVLVPTRAAPGAARVATNGASSSAVVSLSSATPDQLDALDGIGPTLAARIVAWRDQHGGFSSIDQLLEVPGIGRTRLDAIRPSLTL